jgi:hypothetical protein
MLSKEQYELTRKWMYRNARPIDLARWNYHFEGGSKAAVLEALGVYQNEDWGFAHALEADSWNPNSSPIQTWTATEILREIDVTDRGNRIIQGILKFLDSGTEFDGHVWYNTILSNNDYPHAPWWHTESISSCHGNYNPTACLAGFALTYSDKDSNLYATSVRIVKEAIDAYTSEEGVADMHTTHCYIRLMEYIETSGTTKIFDFSKLIDKLKEQVKKSITQNIDEWESGYISKPSQFMDNNRSRFYTDNQIIAEYECEHIMKTRLDDGTWNIPWSWSLNPEEWAISKNWWKGNVAILNMLYLRGMDK